MLKNLNTLAITPKIMTFQRISKYFLIILGLFMFSSYIWLRFLRERFPKNIPINLSIIGFLILIYICCIYAYVVYSYMRKIYTPKPLVIYIINFIYKPLITFDTFIKSLPGIEIKYLKFMVYLSYKLKYVIQDTSIFYFIFGILPRLVLVTALFIDVFWFHKLYYIYKVLLIGILLFLRKYIIYCFKHAQELLIKQKEPYIENISTDYIHSIYMEYYGYLYDPTHKDYEEDAYLEVPPTMCIPLDRFIQLQTNSMIYGNKLYKYVISNTQIYWDKVRIKYNIKPREEIPTVIIFELYDKKKIEINNIVQMSVIIEYYNISNNCNEKYNNVYKLIFTNYLLCWLYILITSSSTLSIDSYIYILNVILTILFLFIMLINHLYLIYLYKVNDIMRNNKKNEEDKLKNFRERPSF